MSTQKKTSSAALVSVAAGLLALASISFFWPLLFTMTLSTVAVVSGHTGLTAVRNDPDRLDGSATAITGLVIGYLGLVAGLVAVLLLNMGFMSFGGR
jgi:hypothetical protein